MLVLTIVGVVILVISILAFGFNLADADMKSSTSLNNAMNRGFIIMSFIMCGGLLGGIGAIGMIIQAISS